MNQPFLNGMDVSFLDEIEQAGGRYYDGANPADCLDIMKDHGVNSIRLRIWNNPAGGFCNLERTLAMAKRIKERKLHFLLDFHYSDSWADPAKQIKPAAWSVLDFPGLKQAVRDYTADVLASLGRQGTPPDSVQIGNEITPGFLWNDGKVAEEYDTDGQWEKFAALLDAGIEAARSFDRGMDVMIHIDRGGDWPAADRFFARMRRHGVDYDTIGLSFYPWWHGTLGDLEQTLHGLAVNYGKPIVVVETAYPWTIEKKQGLGFIVEREDQLLPPYEASPEGQARYMRDFLDVIQRTPNGKGVGFHYWEPDWIPAKKTWSVGHDNHWTNLTLFDFEGRRLPALRF